jgi:ribokinase
MPGSCRRLRVVLAVRTARLPGVAENAVLVAGNVNVDLVALVPHRPRGGETVLATGFEHHAGGKGANQAAAAARAGAQVVLVAAVGDDPTGADQLAALTGVGVDVSATEVVAGVATGSAMITVTPDGENSIVVAGGANASVSPSAVEAVLAERDDVVLVVLQTELATDVVEAAAAACGRRGIRYLVNNGPYVTLAPAATAGADPLVLNEHEAADLCGTSPGAVPDDPVRLLERVLDTSGARSVVVTLGARGAVHADRAERGHVPAPRVEAVDTTGAGDAFVGTLAARLAQGEGLGAAVAASVAAAGRAVTWPGARPPDDLPPLQHP